MTLVKDFSGDKTFFFGVGIKVKSFKIDMHLFLKS